MGACCSSLRRGRHSFPFRRFCTLVSWTASEGKRQQRRETSLRATDFLLSGISSLTEMATAAAWSFAGGGDVDRATFEEHLREVGRRVVLFAREHVLQKLPNDMAFRAYPNRSFDGNPRVWDEVVFPDESLPDGEFLGPWST